MEWEEDAVSEELVGAEEDGGFEFRVSVAEHPELKLRRRGAPPRRFHLLHFFFFFFWRVGRERERERFRYERCWWVRI